MERTALITGGTRGIGLGIARCLAKEGLHLAVNGTRDESKIARELEELRNFGIKVVYCQGNINDKRDREKILNTTECTFSHLNVLINNAGVAPQVRNDILKTTEKSFDEVLGINLKGPYFLTQLVANGMIREKKKNPGFEACIINISSVSATLASLNRGEYCISKAGMSMMTQLYASRLSEFEIPVYEIRPGIVDTDMTSGAKEKYDSLIENGLCLQKRWGYPEDVGKAAAMLVRKELPYSTGQVIMIDGGMTVGRL